MTDLDQRIAALREDHNDPSAWSRDAMSIIDEQAAEIERLRQDCAEAYQVVGAATFDGSPNYTDDDVNRALDNLSAASNGEPRPHDDLLPWPKRDNTRDAGPTPLRGRITLRTT